MAEPDLDPDPTIAPEADWESEGGAVLPPGVTVTIRGPQDASLEELEAAVAAARDALPTGYRLERD
jgi:hypothetical protein